MSFGLRSRSSRPPSPLVEHTRAKILYEYIDVRGQPGDQRRGHGITGDPG